MVTKICLNAAQELFTKYGRDALKKIRGSQNEMFCPHLQRSLPAIVRDEHDAVVIDTGADETVKKIEIYLRSQNSTLIESFLTEHMLQSWSHIQ